MKKTKISLKQNSAPLLVDRLIDKSENFKVIQTGYTSQIQTQNINYFCYEPTASGRKKEILNYRSKILKQIKEQNIYFDVPKGKIKYFELSKSLQEQKNKTVYNLDISSAYPKCLFNLGFINQALFNDLMQTDKITRLKAIGSIATRKLVTTFENGIPVNTEIMEDKYCRDIFFLLCYEIGELIYKISQEMKSFLFFWFDGIYFTNKKEMARAEQILTEANYNFKSEILKKFTVKNDDIKKTILITYQKKEGKKTFNLPQNLKISKF